MTTFKEQLAEDMACILGDQEESGELHTIDSVENVACVFETARVESSGYDGLNLITKCLIISTADFSGRLFGGRSISVDGEEYRIGDFKTYPAHHEIFMSRYG